MDTEPEAAEWAEWRKHHDGSPCALCGDTIRPVTVRPEPDRPTFDGQWSYNGDPDDEPCTRCDKTYAQHNSPDGQSPAECPSDRPSKSVRDLLKVAKAYSSRDDWNVKSIYVSTLKSLAADLAAGDDPVMLVVHAKHVGNDCAESTCKTAIPHYLAQKGA